MKQHKVFNLAALVLLASAPLFGQTTSSAGGEAVTVTHGAVTLHALLWRPAGRGPFPAVLLNHGSGRTREELERLGPYESQAEILGPVFTRHGYVFLYLFRRGVGLSADQGTSAVEQMNREGAAHGPEARNALQMRLLEGGEMDDAMAALKFLRELHGVDRHRIALVGHSFGGSLTLLQAERAPDVRAVVICSGAGYSWDRSPELRSRLEQSVAKIKEPIFFIHAENDFSLNSGKELDARLAKLGRPHLLKIYPPVGKTVEDGHGMLYLAVSTWEPDVFAFLGKNLR